jgi:hypothetical protein
VVWRAVGCFGDGDGVGAVWLWCGGGDGGGGVSDVVRWRCGDGDGVVSGMVRWWSGGYGDGDAYCDGDGERQICVCDDDGGSFETNFSY